MRRWLQRPEGSNWGDFGDDDRIGRLNLINAEKVLEGIREVKEGKTFCLSLPLDYPGGNALNINRNPPILRPLQRHGKVNFNCEMNQFDQEISDVMSDDLAILHLQYSTQWDAFAHVGTMFDLYKNGEEEAAYYNGFSARDSMIYPDCLEDTGLQNIKSQSTSSAIKLGIEHLAEHGLQGRAVMIDLAHHLGTERTNVGYEIIKDIIEKDQLKIGVGDILCLHTGYAEALLNMNKSPNIKVLNRTGAVLNGGDPKLLEWITDSGIAAIAADNYSVEEFPYSQRQSCCSALPLHQHCLFKLGIPLGELWYLSDLAKYLRTHHRSSFLLTAPPLRLTGAVGSPVTPIATV